MKNLNYTAGILLIFLLGACSKRDAYKSFLEEKEIKYTGKADSVKVYPGRNRIKLSWLLTGDPKVSRCKVYWNARTDSAEVSVKRTDDVDTISLILEDMNEGAYNFDIYTFDDSGNRSVLVSASGISYGSQYQASLLNRAVKSAELKEDKGVTVWYDADGTAIGTEVKYRNNAGNTRSLLLEAGADSLILPDYKAGSKFEYRTLYLPDSAAIDTFYTDHETTGLTEDITRLYLKNPGDPFEHADWDGNRWGLLKDWKVNDAVKNQSGYGSFDGINGGGYLSMEKWTGQPEITNGKIYQTITLPAGRYSFEASFEANSVQDPAYKAVAAGSTLPDVSDIGNALASAPLAAPLSFELSSQATVSIGFVATLTQDKQNFRAHWVRLYKLP